MESVFEQGAQAYRDGLKEIANPYGIGEPDHYRWLQGWLDEREKQREQETE